MPFWIMFLFWLGSTVLSALLNKPKIENARATGLDEFKVPTSMEGRAVPIVVGKCRLGGVNTLWYGDLKSVAITDKVGGFLGIGAKKVTKGYKYYLGVQLGLCRGPIGGIDRVWFNDKVIYSGGETAGPLSLTDLSFFGGADSGGGYDFDIDLFTGSKTQGVSSYLVTQQSPTPAYRRTAYVTITDGAGGPGYIGNYDSLRNFAFEPFWYPNSLAVTGGKEKIGEDANPICFLYEILVDNDDWGLEFDPNDVLVTGTSAEGALRALAEDVADEGLGFSMVIDQQTEALEIIKEIERHVDGKFRLDLTDGKYKIVLARPPVGTVEQLDETNITELENFSRGNWSETKNEIKIQYADRAKDYDDTYASDHDGANLDIVGRKNIATLRFPGVKDATLANLIAARELRGLAFPIAQLRVKVDRSQWALQIGDPFDWIWPDLGIDTALPFRVTRVQYEDDHQGGEITLDAIEDVFRLETVGFNDPPPTFWTPPARTAQDPLDARLWVPPYQLALYTGTYHPVLLASRDGGLHLSYDIYTVFGAAAASPTTGDFRLTNEAATNWTPVASLAAAVPKDQDGPPHYDTTITIDGFNDITLGVLQDAASATVDEADPANVILVNDEVMYFTNVTDNMDGSFDLDVERGTFGTIPAEHANNDRVWFVGLGGDAVSEDPTFTTLGAAMRCRVVTRTPSSELTLASAPNIPLASSFTPTLPLPYAPGNPVVSSQLMIDGDWTKLPGVLRWTWEPRANTQPFDTLQDEGTYYANPSATYTIEVRRVDTDALVVNRRYIPASSTAGGEFNVTNFIPQTTPGTPDELDFYASLKAVIGADSQVWTTQNFEVFGFGLDFGNDFGGQAESGDPNLGVVVNQGDAPYVPEPVPGNDTLREMTFTFSGTPTGTEDIRVYWTYIGGSVGTYSTNVDITGASAEELAESLVEEIEAKLALGGLPDSVRAFIDIQRFGALVKFTSYYGSFSGAAQNFAGASYARLEQEPKGTTTSRFQSAFVDHWDSVYSPFLGEATDVLAPEDGDEYEEKTTLSVSVRALNYDKALELAISPDGRPLYSRTFSFFGTGDPFAPLNRTGSLQQLFDRMKAQQTFMDITRASFGQNTDSPTTENGNNLQMTRSGITVLPLEGFAVAVYGPRGAQQVNNSDTGHPAIMKQIRGPLYGAQQQQVVKVNAWSSYPFGNNFTVGDTFILTLNGTDITYVADAPDVALEGATSRYRDPVMEYWEANLPSGFTGEIARWPQRDTPRVGDGRVWAINDLYIRRTSFNTTFTYNASAGLGTKVTVDIT